MPCPVYAQLLSEKPKKHPRKTVMRPGYSYKPERKFQKSPLAEQSFGMYNIRIHLIVFELCVSGKKKKKNKDKQN